jgi:DNA helicase-2/ATP-dependent DNA helicase PcrA
LSIIPPNNDAFSEALKTLNPAQRQAVEQIEGPVLVLAGPGTGKTQVLAARIGNILLQTDTRPQNILCLTFTDAGVNAMRQRLLTWIGPDAHRVAIMTYHSFCNRVIQENMGYFGTQDLEAVSELEQIELVRGVLDKQLPDHPLRADYKSPYQSERQLRNLFSLMKSEGWKPGDIQKAVDIWLKQLPEHPDFIYQRNTKNNKKGDPKSSKMEEETLRMTRLKSAADLYPFYNNALGRSGRYEFEDMILWTLRAFEDYPELLRNYQERYLYVLVDEYQDTNGAQNKLLDLLLNYWETPNIFIVGDDDQSIFEFQGARLQNLLDFYQKHKNDLLTVTLTDNYRSTQSILDAAHQVIERNHLRAVLQFETPVSKTLRAARQESGVVEQVIYPDKLSEEVAVVRQVGELLAQGVIPGEIAVIFARHKQVTRIITLLEKQGIAYDTKRPVDILSISLIRQIRDIMSYLRDEMRAPFSGEYRLFRILHAPFFQIEPVALARMAMRLNTSPGLTWREALLESDWQEAQFLVQLPGVDDAGDGLANLLERIFTKTGILRYVLNAPDKAWYLQVLSTWMAFVRKETLRGTAGLSGFLDVLDNMQENRVSLPLQQTVRMGNGIQLLTAHGAKGLEFAHVFLPDCSKDSWEPQSRDGQGHFAFPPTLTRSGEEDAMESRRRLFFVAMTRAKTHLHLSCAQKDDLGKPVVHARFWDETGLPSLYREESYGLLLASQALLLGESEMPVITLPDTAVFALFLEQFSLSAKGLNKYLRCPLAYYFEEVLRVPLATSEAAATGLAIHTALQHYFLLMQKDEKREFSPADKLQQLFEQDMEHHRGLFSAQTWQQRLSTGRRTLERYRIEQLPYWKKRAQVEFRVSQVELEGIPLVGVIDKIEFLDHQSIRVVDYKTGNYDRKKTALPDADNQYGGEFYRQLLFYKVLLEQSRIFSETVSSGVISWIEPDKKGNFRYDELAFSKEDASWMRQLIVDTAAKIKALQFTNGCGKPECAWCRMLSDRTLPDHIVQPEEELDD